MAVVEFRRLTVIIEMERLGQQVVCAYDGLETISRNFRKMCRRELFAIKCFPLLALHVMGNKQPSPGDKEDFFNCRSKVFPLIQGWAEVLHRTFNNNHHKETKEKYLRILCKHTTEDNE
ncbi:hypothetical protein LguiB_020396 [Lonicera macranthoides]